MQCHQLFKFNVPPSELATYCGLTFSWGIKGWFSVTWRDEALVANIYSVKRVCIGSLRLASNLNKNIIKR